MSVVILARGYLRTRRNFPRADKALLLLLVPCAAAMLIGMTDSFALAMLPLLVLTPPVYVATAVLAVIALRRGDRAAGYLLLAFSGIFLASILIPLGALNILPQAAGLDYSGLLGSVLALVLLAVGLGDRVRRMQEERQSAMRNAAEVEKRILAQSNEKLKRLDRLKDDFLANTSHELRTPLNGIIGITDSLLGGVAGPLPGGAVENLELVSASGRRLAGLVNDILDFAKLRHGDLHLERRPIDPRPIIEIVLKLSKPLAAGKNLELQDDLASTVPMIDADASASRRRNRRASSNHSPRRTAASHGSTAERAWA